VIFFKKFCECVPNPFNDDVFAMSEWEGEREREREKEL